MNQSGKEGLIWKWERKEKEWMKFWKEDKNENRKEKGKSD